MGGGNRGNTRSNRHKHTRNNNHTNVRRSNIIHKAVEIPNNITLLREQAKHKNEKITTLNNKIQIAHNDIAEINNKIPVLTDLINQYSPFAITVNELDTIYTNLEQKFETLTNGISSNNIKIQDLQKAMIVNDEKIKRLIGETVTIEGNQNYSNTVDTRDVVHTAYTHVSNKINNINAKNQEYDNIKQQNEILAKTGSDLKNEIATNEQGSKYENRNMLSKRNILFFLGVTYFSFLAIFAYCLYDGKLNANMYVKIVIFAVLFIYPFVAYSIQQRVYDVVYYVYCLLTGKIYVPKVTTQQTWSLFTSFPTYFTSTELHE